MRVGLLTYHGAANPGSVLQTICGVRVLRALLPDADVAVIDLTPTQLARREARAALGRRPPFVDAGQVRRAVALRRLLRRQVSFAGRPTIAGGERATAYVRSLGLDAVVVGSDTVWEITGTGNVASPPNVFWATGTAPWVAALAVSADTTDPALVEPRRDALRAALDGFAAVTVRDRTTADLVTDLCGRTPPVVPDPTLLADWSDLVAPGAPPLPDEAVGLAVGDPAVRERAARELVDRGHAVVSLLGPVAVPGVVAAGGLGLPELLRAHAHLAGLVTDRFHATIFHLVLGRGPVTGIETAAKYPGGGSKLADLLDRLDQRQALVRVDAGSSGSITTARSDPAEVVRPRLAAWRDDAQVTLRALADALGRRP